MEGGWVTFEYGIMCHSQWKSKVLCQIIYPKAIHLLRTIVVLKLFFVRRKNYFVNFNEKKKRERERETINQAALFQSIQNINNMMWLSVNIINHIQYDILKKYVCIDVTACLFFTVHSKICGKNAII